MDNSFPFFKVITQHNLANFDIFLSKNLLIFLQKKKFNLTLNLADNLKYHKIDLTNVLK